MNGAICTISANGANFCQVDIINPVVRSSPCSTEGSQKCIGARPSLRARAAIISVVEAWCDEWLMFHSPVIHAFIELANRMVAAAVACARKYFVVASTARGWWCCAMSGRIASVLISRPIQARSQWELEKVSVVPRPRLIRKIVSTCGFISKRRSLTYIFGVWAQKLYLAYLTRKWCSGNT